MQTKYGFFVVDSRNIYSVLWKNQIRPWRRCGGPVSIDKHIKINKGLTEKEKRDFKFMPKTEIVLFKAPDENIFRGFRESGSDGTVVFAVLPGNLLVICAEFKHGCEAVSLFLPGGILEKNESPINCAKREFEEETGVMLKNLVLLNAEGIPLDARRTNRKNFYFLGMADDPPVIKKQELSPQEFLSVLLIDCREWVKLITQKKPSPGYVIDGYAFVATFLALERLRMTKQKPDK